MDKTNNVTENERLLTKIRATEPDWDEKIERIRKSSIEIGYSEATYALRVSSHLMIFEDLCGHVSKDMYLGKNTSTIRYCEHLIKSEPVGQTYLLEIFFKGIRDGIEKAWTYYRLAHSPRCGHDGRLDCPHINGRIPTPVFCRFARVDPGDDGAPSWRCMLTDDEFSDMVARFEVNHGVSPRITSADEYAALVARISDESRPSRQIKKITIIRAEGPTRLCGIPHTFEAFEDATAWLHSQAHTFPASGGYDKHDFSIEWMDGKKYDGRLDCQHYSCPFPDLDVRHHITSFVTAAAGYRCPSHYTSDQFRAYLESVEVMRPGSMDRSREFLKDRFGIVDHNPLFRVTEDGKVEVRVS